MGLLIPELCFALKHGFSAVSGLGMPFFLNLMKLETFLLTYLKILLLRKTNKCPCKGHKSESCQSWLMSNS